MTSPEPEEAEIRRLVERAEQLVREGVGPGQVTARRRRRVAEWLHRPGRPAPETEVTDVSCDASGEYTSDSSDSEALDCSVATCREVDPDPASRLTDCLESAQTQAALPTEPGQEEGRPPTSLRLTPPGHPTSADPLTPTPTSSSGGSTVLTSAAPNLPPTNQIAGKRPAGAGLRRGRTRRPISGPSSDSEGGAHGSVTRRRRPDDPGKDAGVGSSLACPTDATLEDISTSDVTEDTNDVISSVSEQAWDPYQEFKEISDLGSESAADPDALRRFLDTDDYRQFLDSVSDCTSSQVSSVTSPRCRPHPARRRRAKARPASDSSCDSDADREEVQAALAESRSRLLLTQTELSRLARLPDPICSGVLTACRAELTRLERLLIVLDPWGRYRGPSSPYGRPAAAADVVAVMSEWSSLQSAALSLRRRADSLSRLQGQIRSLRHCLTSLDDRCSQSTRDVATAAELTHRIDAVKAVRLELAERRQELVTINADVHQHTVCGGPANHPETSAGHRATSRCGQHALSGKQLPLTDGEVIQLPLKDGEVIQLPLKDGEVIQLPLKGGEVIQAHQLTSGERQADGEGGELSPTSDAYQAASTGTQSALKQDVVTLYRIWEEVDSRARRQLDFLTEKADAWRQFEAEKVALASAMEADRRRLGVLQQALRPDMSSSPAEGDRRHGSDQHQDTAAQGSDLTRLTTVALDDLSEGTSGYDSTCSDDLSERERRLGRLRRLASDLEPLLSPGGQAWTDISQTLSTATSGLLELQRSCRRLVVKSACQLPTDGGRRRGSLVSRRRSGSGRTDGVPLRRSGGRRLWLRRVLLTALPIQLGLLLWLCAVCLLGPSCCDDLNYLASSLTPQLRYVRGPPPM